MQDENGYTALHHSVSKNNYAAVIYLLNVANIDLNVIYYFFYFSYLDRVDYLIKNENN
jgi:ankyrin repeat protein